MDRLNDILPFISKRQCALFIGAGISKIAGCYEWNSIVREMLNQPLIKEKGINQDELLVSARYEEIIDYCQQLFFEKASEHTFWGIARKAITFNPKLFIENYLPLIRMLKQIYPLPKIILTTNIDNCLEHTNEYDLSEIFFKVGDFIGERLDSSGIFHIHGYIEEFEQSLLTRKSYIKRYQENSFRDFLKCFFSRYSVLFLGYSLRDQEIKDIIRETKDNRRKHFLLIPEEDEISFSQISLLLDLYGVVTVVYGRQDSLPNTFKEWIIRNFKPTALQKEDETNA